MREIKFRAWVNAEKRMIYNSFAVDADGGTRTWGIFAPITVMQFTGLRDKNGLTDIYEGDILDENGLIRGNVYESPQIFREGIDCVITGMGTSAWRGAESIAMGRGCKYSE